MTRGGRGKRTASESAGLSKNAENSSAIANARLLPDS